VPIEEGEEEEEEEEEESIKNKDVRKYSSSLTVVGL
jgi:hypothetical protein